MWKLASVREMEPSSIFIATGSLKACTSTCSDRTYVCSVVKISRATLSRVHETFSSTGLKMSNSSGSDPVRLLLLLETNEEQPDIR